MTLIVFSKQTALIALWRMLLANLLKLLSTKSAEQPGKWVHFMFRPLRAVRLYYRWSWHDRLACNGWWGPPQLRITVAGFPTLSRGSPSISKEPREMNWLRSVLPLLYACCIVSKITKSAEEPWNSKF